MLLAEVSQFGWQGLGWLRGWSASRC